MSTTIRIKPKHRAKLLEIAQRGEKGISSVVAEAIGSCLEHESALEKRRKKALSLGGCLSPNEAEEFYRVTARLRKSWRDAGYRRVCGSQATT